MKDALPSNTYMRSHIPPIGPHGEEQYYYNLTAIAVDWSKFYQQTEQGSEQTPNADQQALSYYRTADRTVVWTGRQPDQS